jgi:hypothetical protein
MKPPQTAMPLCLRPRHKWFTSNARESEAWWGPYPNIQDAALASYLNSGGEEIFITQGRKLKKIEQYSEYTWKIEANLIFEIKL